MNSRAIVVHTYGTGGFSTPMTLGLAALNPTRPLPVGPEGIAFDSKTGHLFIISERDLPYAIFEYTLLGAYAGQHDIGGFIPHCGCAPTPAHDLEEVDAPQGIAFGPSSTMGWSFYLADGGVDNGNVNPAVERGGVIYEGRIG